jgi:hypothetical protein
MYRRTFTSNCARITAIGHWTSGRFYFAQAIQEQAKWDGLICLLAVSMLWKRQATTGHF